MGIRLRTSYVAVLFASLAFTAACGDDDGIVPPPAPAELSIVGGGVQDGTAGFPVAQQLRVRVETEDGDPVANVPVIWTVTSGGGSLVADTTRTNTAGEASNSWTLGSAAGAQTVTARAGNLPAVTFTANATTIAPLFLVRSAGDNQIGFRLERLNSVRVDVIGPNGLPVVGVPVTWTVIAGNGTVTPGVSTTDANGRATAVWALGPNAGEQQLLRATAGGVSTTFTANTVSNPCLASRPISFLRAGDRELDAADCLLTSGPRTGSFIEYFTLPVTSQLNGVLTLSSAAFDPHFVLLRGTSGSDTVAFHSDTAANSGTVRVMLAPGTYRIGASSVLPGQTGAFTLTESALPNVTNCEADGRVYVTPGAVISQALSATDCAAAPLSGAAGTAYHDRYRMYLTAGQRITITFVGAAPLDPIIVLFPPGLAAVVVDNGGTGGTETLSNYTVPVTGLYILDARTWTTNQLGPYTVTISPAT